MKKHLAIIAFAFLLSCDQIVKNDPDSALPKAKNIAGIGLLHLSPYSNYILYKSFSDSVAYDSIQISQISFGLQKGKTRFKTSTLGKRLNPYTLDGGDSDLEGESHIKKGLIAFSPEIIFRVVSKVENTYEVMIDETSHETSFIKLMPENNLLLTTASKKDFFYDPNFVESSTPNWYFFETWEQALKRAWSVEAPDGTVFLDKPDGNPIAHSLEYYKLDSVDGEWARFSDSYPNGEEKTQKGWARWKRNDSILVNIILNGGYE